MADKIDFKKTLECYQAQPGQFQLIDVPVMQYLMIDGQGDPNTSPEYLEAVEALYPIAYKLKFVSKQELGRDYVVPPLEGLWWAEDMDAFTVARDKSQWEWTMMLMVPEWIDREMVEAAVDQAGAKGANPRIDDVSLQLMSEGSCVQILHIGPYDEEAEVLSQLHNDYIPTNGLRLTGRHHEIYLGDPRKAAPEKLRTILRQPVSELPE